MEPVNLKMKQPLKGLMLVEASFDSSASGPGDTNLPPASYLFISAVSS